MLSTTVKMQRPDWVNPALYPFESHFFDSGEGRMHYIDEGAGEVLLFVHGTPTWSFLYRQQIQALRTHYRCIAVDHLGFGLSDKPEAGNYHPARQAERLEQLVSALGLQEITLIVHDFGGPIGLHLAIRHPERVRRVILFNSWLWSTAEDPNARQAARFLKSRLGKWIYRQTNFSPKILLKQGFRDKKTLTREIHRHYLRPFGGAADRSGLFQIAQSLLGASDWFGELYRQRAQLAAIPALQLWGEQDPFIQGYQKDRWLEIFPDLEQHSLPAGHFAQEECAVEVNEKIRHFLEGQRL